MSLLSNLLAEVNGVPLPPPEQKPKYIPPHKRSEAPAPKSKKPTSSKQPPKEPPEGKYMPPHKRLGRSSASSSSGKSSEDHKTPQHRQPLASTSGTKQNVLAGSRADTLAAHAMPSTSTKKPVGGAKKPLDYKSLVTDKLNESKKKPAKRAKAPTPAKSHLDEKWFKLQEPDLAKVRPVFDAEPQINQGRFILKSPYIPGIQFAFNWTSPNAKAPTAIKKLVKAKTRSQTKRARTMTVTPHTKGVPAFSPPTPSKQPKASSTPQKSPLSSTMKSDLPPKAGVKRTRDATEANDVSEEPPLKKPATTSKRATRAKGSKNPSSVGKEAGYQMSATAPAIKGPAKSAEISKDDSPVTTETSSTQTSGRQRKKLNTKATKGKEKVDEKENVDPVEKSNGLTSSEAMKLNASSAKTSSSPSTATPKAPESSSSSGKFKLRGPGYDTKSNRLDSMGRRVDGVGIAKVTKKKTKTVASATKPRQIPAGTGSQGQKGTGVSSQSQSRKRKNMVDDVEDDESKSRAAKKCKTGSPK